ncbi:MAG: GNAT family N-acetyltransferase [Acidobacteriota bacterium]
MLVARDGGARSAAAAGDPRRGRPARSFAVAADRRGSGLGSRLVAAVLARAADQGLAHGYLFTPDAAGFFAKLGFGQVRREDLPAAIASSSQATGGCCATAACMRIAIAAR